MRAAAQFNRVIRVHITAHRKHTDLVAVLLAEQRHRPGLDRISMAHQARRNVRVAAHLRVHVRLDERDLFGGERLRMAEIETEAIFRNERALLRDVRTEPIAKRGVQQVGRRMVGADAATARGIDVELHDIADADAALGNARLMRMQLAERLGRRFDNGLETASRNRSRVSGLAAGFAVERRLVGEDDDGVARARRFHARAVLDDGDHLALRGVGGVAREFGRAEFLGDVEPHAFVGLRAGARPGGARGGLLRGHRRVETALVDRQTLPAQLILGEIEWEAVGVIELERRLAGKHGTFAHARRRLVEQAKPRFQRLPEACFLQL